MYTGCPFFFNICKFAIYSNIQEISFDIPRNIHLVVHSATLQDFEFGWEGCGDFYTIVGVVLEGKYCA